MLRHSSRPKEKWINLWITWCDEHQSSYSEILPRPSQPHCHRPPPLQGFGDSPGRGRMAKHLDRTTPTRAYWNNQSL
jgi:hypothetical protein